MHYITASTFLCIAALYGLWRAWREQRKSWRSELRTMHAALADLLSDRE